jgi:hypothetical protein
MRFPLPGSHRSPVGTAAERVRAAARAVVQRVRRRMPTKHLPRLVALTPVIIGATGGSGTRVVARVVRRGGMYIGADLYDSEDPPELGVFSDRWINLFMTGDSWGLPAAVERAMARELAAIMGRHLGTHDPQLGVWGWKEPRSIFLLPFFHRHFPLMRFVHVLRDGRDMAFSENQFQLNKHGHTLLTPMESHESQATRSMLLWSRLNVLAADYGEHALGTRYVRIRFEDLCREPGSTIERLFDFLGLEDDASTLALKEVAPPRSLGRWRAQDPELVTQLEAIGRAALGRFGYLDGA